MASHAELLAGLDRLVRRTCASVGVELVELELKGSSRHRVLRVDVDRAGPAGIDLGDCKRVSEALGIVLEEEDPIGGSYRLEVSSPGIDRPIRSDDDIRRNTGRRVTVTLAEPVDERSAWSGVLIGADDEVLVVDDGGPEPVRLPRQQIEKVLQEIPF